MISTWKKLILSAAMVSLVGEPLIAQNRAKSKAPTKSKKVSNSTPKKSPEKSAKVSKPDRDYDAVKRKYRQAERSDGQLWAELASFDERINSLNRTNQYSLLQTQANLLSRANFPYLSALYSSEALLRSSNPNHTSLEASWTTLWKSSQKQPMQSLLEELSRKLKGVEAPPSAFGNNWFYHVANAQFADGNVTEAVKNLQKLRINDQNYLSALFQLAQIQLANNKEKEGELTLRKMLNSVTQTLAPLDKETLKELSNYAKISLARLYYQQKEFQNAIRFFRAVDRDSTLFYDSLFEQAWAFFMAGYPNHTLGALYSVESPFFKDRFNPEASVLRAITYYWMCRYDDSKSALADFTARHADAVEGLNEFLSRRRLNAETAYTLFENYTSGVSTESLGMPKAVLESAAIADGMLALRTQYSGIVSELERLRKQGVHGSKATSKASSLLDQQIKSFRTAIGTQYIAELQNLKSQFERLHEQSQFLYVELLMSEKEQLLGRELHASTKIDKVSKRQNIAGWGDKNQSWGNNKLKEYWWDELGYYIFDAQPLCKTRP